MNVLIKRVILLAILLNLARCETFADAIPTRMGCVYEYCRFNAEKVTDICTRFAEVLGKIYKSKFGSEMSSTDNSQAYVSCAYTHSEDQYNARSIPTTTCPDEQVDIYFSYLENTPIITCEDPTYFGTTASLSFRDCRPTADPEGFCKKNSGVWAAYLEEKYEYKFLPYEIYSFYSICVNLISSEFVLDTNGYSSSVCTEDQETAYLELYGVSLDLSKENVDFRTYYTYERSTYIKFSLLFSLILTFLFN